MPGCLVAGNTSRAQTQDNVSIGINVFLPYYSHYLLETTIHVADSKHCRWMDGRTLLEGYVNEIVVLSLIVSNLCAHYTIGDQLQNKTARLWNCCVYFCSLVAAFLRTRKMFSQENVYFFL